MTDIKTLTQNERDRIDVRAYAVRNTLESTNRLLGLDEGKVKVIRPGRETESFDGIPPAWTDGKLVTINGFVEPVYTALRDGWTEDDIFVVTALNYHELAHCFFMPRIESEFCKRVRDAGYWQELNILQDMHDESMFVGRYRPSRNYFVRIAVEYLARTKHQIDSNYVLIAGRKFLPDDIRDYFLENFAKPDIVDDIDRISTEYNDAVYPRDEEKMFTLIEEYHELLKELSPEGAGGIAQVSEHQEGQSPDGSVMVPASGSTITEEEQESAGKRGGSEQGQESAKADDEGEAPGEGDADAEGEPGDDEKDGKGGASSPHGGQGHERPSLDNILEDAARRATEEVAQELGEKADALDAAQADYRLDIDQLPHRELPLDDDTANAERKVNHALRRLKESFDPGWYKGEEQGRLDFNKLIGHNVTGRTDVFKRWDDGVNDVLDIEAVIAVDLSGSMASLARPTAKALWVTHTALKSHDAEVTVLGYNTDVFLMRQRGERPETFIREYGVGGGTSLSPAILEANKVFASSPRPLKMFFVITDGGWWDKDQAHALLDQATYRTFVIGLGYGVEEYTRIRSVEVAKTIHDIDELPGLFQDIVTTTARHRAEKQKLQGRV